MKTSHPRPVNLNLMTIRFPVTAIISILHRVSGVVLFLLIPGLLYALQMSLASPESFAKLADCLRLPAMKFAVFLTMLSLLYHLVAGIRHLFMDFGFGETLASGRASAYLVLIIVAILGVLVGIKLW